MRRTLPSGHFIKELAWAGGVNTLENFFGWFGDLGDHTSFILYGTMLGNYSKSGDAFCIVG